MRVRLAISLVILSLGTSATLNSFANDNFSHPGGIAELTITKNSTDTPEVMFGINEPVVIEYADYWRILVGLSLETLPGEYVVYIKSGVNGSTVQFQKIIVQQNNYPFHEYSDQKLVNRHIAVKTADSFSDIDYSNTRQPTLPLQWPLEGSWSNNFGHKLYDSKQAVLHTPNSLVISVTELSNVVSPQTAIVSKIDTSASGISTVYLDHGRGLYSILSGLSDITIEVGNGIASGAVIGTLQATGESALDQPVSAGQALMWQTVMNNAYVDPQVLTQLEP